MSGNVLELCQDVWHENYEDAPEDGSDSLVGDDQNLRVFRGGAWINKSINCWVARRFRYGADDSYSFIGFRLAR